MNLTFVIHKTAALLVFILLCVSLPLVGQTNGALENPLVMNSGKPVASREQWEKERRPELLEMFTREMYGRAPAKPGALAFFVLEQDSKALGGKATRKQIKISFNGLKEGPGFELLVYLPNSPKEKHPVILGINFWGNHSVHADPAIHLNTNWIEGGRNSYIDLACVANHQATESCRGGNARQWPVERFIERGYGLATFYRGDIAPDFPHGLTNGVLALYPELQKGDDNFSTIGAWAWALSRAVDYLETDGEVDPKKVVLFGWSRLGKAALWAGATDPRFAVVLSNESGAGGAKLFHRGVGEQIRRLNTNFPHWYAKNFSKYNDKDTDLPFDQHELLALIAPRPLYIGSAIDDKQADAEGEFLSAREAAKVYRLLGTEGLPVEQWPSTNISVQGQIGYHVRSGGHDVLDYDWTQYLAFCDKHLKGKTAATSKNAFVHPGMLHSDSEIRFVRQKIEKGEQPWKGAFEALIKSRFASNSWKAHPQADVVRDLQGRWSGARELGEDAVAAYTQALAWKLTGREEYGLKAIEILNAETVTLKTITGHDAKLLAGITAYKFCNAAELLRSNTKWPVAQQKAFGSLMNNVYYPMMKDFLPATNGNWDASMIVSVMCIGVFCDDRSIYDNGVQYFLHGSGDGALTHYVLENGQCQESTGDQQHTQLGLAFLADACEVGWKQGDDLWGAASNRLALGFEYTAKYNLGEKVEIMGAKPISVQGRGNFRPIYEKVYHHYRDRVGMSLPFTERVLAKVRPEGYHWDHVPWGTLMYAGLPGTNELSKTTP